MRILQLTAGTGSFYCGTCLRDAALVQELRKLGHDALLGSLYLPLVLEDGFAPGQVHMGGVNAYLAQARVRLPRFLQDWLDSPRVLRWAARKGEMTQARKLGPMTVSMLRGAEGEQRRELGKLADWLVTLERPDVVLLSNALLLGLVRPLRELLGVPVLCTLQGEAPFLDALLEPHRGEAWRLAAEHAREAAGFLAVSRYTAELMQRRLALDPARVTVVPNGLDPAPYAPAARFDGPPAIGYLARLNRDKGLPTLVEAFLELKRRPEHRELRLLAAGATLASDREPLEALRERIAAAGHAGAVELASNVTLAEKVALLGRCHVFSVPATYGESFGLYLLEAWAMGLPVVQPDHAAFPELVGATGGGLLVARDDPHALAEGLHALLVDRARARSLGESGRRAVHEHFSGAAMARAVERVCTMACAPAAPVALSR
ncbi:MAG TPA: glycosyltransferase family 4 protein [Planctomycetota bacterium]